MENFGFWEFFAGAGLARLGLGAPWDCLWANDIDAAKGQVYAANFGDDHLRIDDIVNIAPEELPGQALMAWASFPCQDLSLAGWRRGMNARRSGAFWAFWTLMDRLFQTQRRPPIIVLENVVGLLSGDDFIGLSESLTALGMQLGALVVDARHFIPQSRPRVFIIAVDDRIDVSDLHSPSPGEAAWNPNRLLRAQARQPESVQSRWRWWNLPLPDEAPPPVEELIDADSDDLQWYSEEETQKLIAMMNDRHLAKLRTLQNDPRRRVGFIYRRTRKGRQRAELRIDGLAGCLRTPAGGSSRQIVIEAHQGRTRARLLSTREAARLMGCPDHYRLPSSYNAGYHAMGDAVAVPAVSWLSEHLLLPIAHRVAEHRKDPPPSSPDHYQRVHQSDVARRAAAAAAEWTRSNETP